MSNEVFQDTYPDHLSVCYGCGRLNEHGLRIRSVWDGEETVCRFVPEPHHTAIQGIVYGGLIASIIDCHSTASAAAVAYRVAGREMGTDPPLRFLTGSLSVQFVRPTPLGVPLEIRSTAKEVKGRKVVMASTLSAGGVVCATGEVVAIQVPDEMLRPGAGSPG